MNSDTDGPKGSIIFSREGAYAIIAGDTGRSEAAPSREWRSIRQESPGPRPMRSAHICAPASAATCAVRWNSERPPKVGAPQRIEIGEGQDHLKELVEAMHQRYAQIKDDKKIS